MYRYEYVFGIHPFQNQDVKIMQILMKRYPVVFPRQYDNGKDQGYNMPHEFQEIIRDSLSKDYTQRLGSEDFKEEFLNHAFLQKYA